MLENAEKMRETALQLETKLAKDGAKFTAYAECLANFRTKLNEVEALNTNYLAIMEIQAKAIKILLWHLYMENGQLATPILMLIRQLGKDEGVLNTLMEAFENVR